MNTKGLFLLLVAAILLFISTGPSAYAAPEPHFWRGYPWYVGRFNRIGPGRRPCNTTSTTQTSTSAEPGSSTVTVGAPTTTSPSATVTVPPSAR